LTSALSLFVAVLAIQQVGPTLVRQAVAGLRSSLILAASPDVSAENLPSIWGPLGTALLGSLVGIVAPIALVAIGVGLFQIRGRLAYRAIAPDASRINPVSGARRLFGMDGLTNLFWPLLKLVLVTLAVEGPARQALASLPTALGGGIGAELRALGDALLATARNAAGALVLVGIVDYAYRRWQFNRRARMSRRELREELRDTDGDPIVRARLRGLRRRMAQRRMLHAVPKAQVVVVNPTHFAVALSYEPKRMAAPEVVAKGVDYLAEKIIQVARDNRVPVVPNPPLARALYRSVEIGDPVPVALYQAIAEVLAHVYSLRRRS
jgi:flagellar biosynthetic protein FlhB